MSLCEVNVESFSVRTNIFSYTISSLVYPALSAEDQQEWESIEESFFRQEITPQGYAREREKLFVRAGFHVAKQSETEIKKEVDLQNEISDLSFVPKTEFQTKQECAQVNT